MARKTRKTIVTLVDDLTGEAAEDISTVEFGVDGIAYELDLTTTTARSCAMRWRRMPAQVERLAVDAAAVPAQAAPSGAPAAPRATTAKR
jgi:hypothetical protein